MDIDHYFLGNDLIVVTVEHDETEPRGHIDSSANRYALHQAKIRVPRDLKTTLSIINYEQKTLVDGNRKISIYTYETSYGGGTLRRNKKDSSSV